MVCFCDIPLSQIRNHKGRYGSYAIGLSKSWAMKNRVNPVLYTYSGSSVSGKIKILFDLIPNESAETISQQLDFISYIKPYEENLEKPSKPQERDITFYDEREWRYIPDLAGTDVNKYLTNEIFQVSNAREHAQLLLQNEEKAKLKFSPNDIKYIIVNKNSDILKMARYIDGLKGD